jgi:hypothetical protein
MKIAGILLMIAGVMLLLAFVFQLPYLYYLLNGKIAAASNLTPLYRILYCLLLIIAGVFLVYYGRKIRRSTF